MAKTELSQAIKNGQFAEYVSTNWWRMTKEELKAVTAQLLFTMYDNGLTEQDIDMNELLERLDLE